MCPFGTTAWSRIRAAPPLSSARLTRRRLRLRARHRPFVAPTRSRQPTARSSSPVVLARPVRHLLRHDPRTHEASPLLALTRAAPRHAAPCIPSSARAATWAAAPPRGAGQEAASPNADRPRYPSPREGESHERHHAARCGDLQRAVADAAHARDRGAVAHRLAALRRPAVRSNARRSTCATRAAPSPPCTSSDRTAACSRSARTPTRVSADNAQPAMHRAAPALGAVVSVPSDRGRRPAPDGRCGAPAWRRAIGLRTRACVLASRPMSLGATRQTCLFVEPGVRKRARARAAAVLVACLCSTLWVGASAIEVSAAIECGRTKVIQGHALRVQVARGPVSCREARDIIRHHIVDRYTPGDLPVGPGAWGCGTSRSWIVTCTSGRRIVRGRR